MFGLTFNDVILSLSIPSLIYIQVSCKMFFGSFRASATINLKLEVRSVCSHSLRILVRRNLCPEYVRRLADDTPRLTQLTKVQVETKNLLSQLVVSLFKRWEKEDCPTFRFRCFPYLNGNKVLVCGARKYPYLPHGRFFWFEPSLPLFTIISIT